MHWKLPCRPCQVGDQLYEMRVDRIGLNHLFGCRNQRDDPTHWLRQFRITCWGVVAPVRTLERATKEMRCR